jgi:hypothetical protein
MKALVILFIFVACPPPLLAQHYLTAGAGFNAMMYGSKDLDHFKATYNLVNGPNLRAPMKGFDAGVGLRLEAGYRRLGRWCMALLAGWQNYGGKDAAHFGNGEVRSLELKSTHFFVEYELGWARKKFFVTGLVAVFFNRKSTLESEYHGQSSDIQNPLTGTYKSDAHLATDLGIAVGILKEPIFLIGKLTYPIHTGGQSNLLEDRHPEKIADGFNFFPDDFEKYVNRQAYKGVASDIDGLKIVITVAVAIPIY